MELDPKWIRVSSILEMIPTKEEDGHWGYPMQKINRNVLEKKASLGSSVHAAISAHVKKEFYVVDDRENGYLNSYLLWEKEVGISCLYTERRFFCDQLGLTGAVDMIGKLKENGPFHLVDFKCTATANHVKWPLQAAFYVLLAGVNGIELDKRTLFVQLDKEGKAPVVHEYVVTKELTAAAISWYNSFMYLTKR